MDTHSEEDSIDESYGRSFESNFRGRNRGGRYIRPNQTSFRDGLPGSFRDGPHGSFRDGPTGAFRDGPPCPFRDGPPDSFRDGPPGSFRDGPPGSFREGPPDSFRDGSSSSSSHHFQDGGNRRPSYSQNHGRGPRSRFSSKQDFYPNFEGDMAVHGEFPNFQGPGSFQNPMEKFQNYPPNCPNYQGNYNMNIQGGFEIPPGNNNPLMYQPPNQPSMHQQPSLSYPMSQHSVPHNFRLFASNPNSSIQPTPNQFVTNLSPSAVPLNPPPLPPSFLDKPASILSVPLPPHPPEIISKSTKPENNPKKLVSKDQETCNVKSKSKDQENLPGIKPNSKDQKEPLIIVESAVVDVPLPPELPPVQKDMRVNECDKEIDKDVQINIKIDNDMQNDKKIAKIDNDVQIDKNIDKIDNDVQIDKNIDKIDDDVQIDKKTDKIDNDIQIDKKIDKFDNDVQIDTKIEKIDNDVQIDKKNDLIDNDMQIDNEIGKVDKEIGKADKDIDKELQIDNKKADDLGDDKIDNKKADDLCDDKIDNKKADDLGDDKIDNKKADDLGDDIPIPADHSSQAELTDDVKDLSLEAKAEEEAKEQAQTAAATEEEQSKSEEIKDIKELIAQESKLDILIKEVNKQLGKDSDSKASSMKGDEAEALKDISSCLTRGDYAKKLSLPCLGKEAAKKRLKFFSAAKSYQKEKPKLHSSFSEEAEEAAKMPLKDMGTPDEEKKETKKKKKKEKVSVIEQIRDEETRIKEVLNITSSMLPSHTIAYTISDLHRLYDNPEALRKFEERGKDFKEKVAKGEIVYPGMSSSSRERERKSSRSKDSRHSSRGDSKSESKSKSVHGESSRSHEKSKESKSSHSDSLEKSGNTSSRKSKAESEKKRKEHSKKHSEHTPTKTKMPKSWKEAKKLNLRVGDFPRHTSNRSRSRSRSLTPGRSRRDGRRSSRSRSRERIEVKFQKRSVFPEFPKYLETFRASRALSYGNKEYKGSLVQYTHSKPTIAYSINSDKYDAHYWTLNELKIRNSNRPEIREIIDEFLFPEKQIDPGSKLLLPPKPRTYAVADEWVTENLSQVASKPKSKKKTALDYLSSNYDTELSSQYSAYEKAGAKSESSAHLDDTRVSSAPSFFNDESSSDYKSISLEDVSSPENKFDSFDKGMDSPAIKLENTSSREKNSLEKESIINLAEKHLRITKPASPDSSTNFESSEINLRVQELNEEYEAFINTLEFKPEEQVGNFSDVETYEFNSSSLSFEEPPPKEVKVKGLHLFDNPPKTKKEVKKLLLSSKLTKKQRKVLKKLKKKMKKEKKERRRLKKELKKKKKLGKKMKRKQEKLELNPNFTQEADPIVEEDSKPQSSPSETRDSTNNDNEMMEEYDSSNNDNEIVEEYQVVEWEQYHDENDDDKSEEEIVEELNTNGEHHEPDSSSQAQGFSDDCKDLNESSNTSDLSDIHESGYSTQAKSDITSISPFSLTKDHDSDSNHSGLLEGNIPDTYSPSNMSVCSVDSPLQNKISSPYSPPSPEHYADLPNVDPSFNNPPSPYSPSSPHSSSASDSSAQESNLIPSLDAIPMPPSFPTFADKGLSSSGSTPKPSKSTSKCKDRDAIPVATEKATEIEIPKSPVEITQKPMTKNDTGVETSPFKKSMQPVTFRLSLSKQSAGLKLLQKTPLPGFIEEEEDRRSPLFDPAEGPHFSRADKTKFPPLKSIKEPQKSEEVKLSSKPDPKDEEKQVQQVQLQKSPSPTRSSREKEKSHRRSHPSSKDPEEDKRASRSSKDEEKPSSKSSSNEQKESRSPSGRRERKRESSYDGKRRKRSRSPLPSTRSSFSKTGDSTSSQDRRVFRSRSRSPPGRSKSWSRSPSPGDRFEGRSYRRDSRSPSSKWKRIQSPPPRRYRDKSPLWGHGQEERPRYLNREEERSRLSYSPRSSRDRGHSRLSPSPERVRSPIRDTKFKEDRRASKPSVGRSQESPEFSDFTGRPIDSISNLFPSTENNGNWEWMEPSNSKEFYAREEAKMSGIESPQRDMKKTSFSPDLSPKRLSLDERLKQEHGVDTEDHPPHSDYPRQRYYWEYNPPPTQVVPMIPPSGKAQVIRVGNVLQVLPQESSPEKNVPSMVQTCMSPIKIPPPNMSPAKTPTPAESPSIVSPAKLLPSTHSRMPLLPEVKYEQRPPAPQIVQTGNVIQVVPSDSFETSVSSESQRMPTSLLESSHSQDITNAKIMKSSQEICPVPPPSSTVTSNPLAFISSLLASSMSQPILSIDVSSCTSAPTVASDAAVSFTDPPRVDAPSPPQPSLTKPSSDLRHGEQVETQTHESSLPVLDSQQQQAIISAAVAAAASGVTASNLPIAHLISVLQQQSLLLQPSVPTPPISQGDTNAISHPTPSEAAEVKPPIDLETFKQQRKERKERKKKEREQRKKARREKALLKRLQFEEQRAQEARQQEARIELMDDDDLVFKEAITEVPELGSPIPEYETYNDDEFPDDEDDDEQRPPSVPLPLPPEKGILIGPSYRILRNDFQRKSVSFADGVMPGYGTSPSGGEEIHSPPPPNVKLEKKEKKKLRRRRKVKVRVIKQYVKGGSRMDSPPPPPETPPSSGVLKLYPGCTHYTCTAPNTFVIYTQQPVRPNGSELGIAASGTVTIPPGMLIHSSALSKGFNPELRGIVGTSIPPSMPHTYPSYGFSAFFPDGQQTREQNAALLPSPLA